MPRVVLPLLLTLSCSLFADQVVLKNGDRLSGTIEKSDDKSLVIKTEFAGEVTVQWPAVQEIHSEQQLHVGLKDGRTLVGPVTTSDGSIAVSTRTGGSTRGYSKDGKEVSILASRSRAATAKPRPWTWLSTPPARACMTN